MAFLLDTHALIWWWDEDDKLSASARTVLGDSARSVLVSSVTAFEIANKVRAGKLDAMAAAVEGDSFADWVRLDGFGQLDLRSDHGVLAGRLAGDHRDPFDRMIAAQALIENLTVLTRDLQIAAFGCRTLW